MMSSFGGGVGCGGADVGAAVGAAVGAEVGAAVGSGPGVLVGSGRELRFGRRGAGNAAALPSTTTFGFDVGDGTGGSVTSRLAPEDGFDPPSSSPPALARA